MPKQYYVYILANRRNGTLYTGVTSDLVRRVYEHRQGHGSEFTAEHGVDRLVYFDVLNDPENAIQREKQIKNWKRRWKLELIESRNPDWKDLYDEIVG